MFDTFDAGAGVLDDELFTEEQNNSFLPRDDNDNNNPNNLPFNIFISAESRMLLVLILFVISLMTLKDSPIISIFMILFASIMIRFYTLALAFLISVQIMYPNVNRSGFLALIIGIGAILIVNFILGQSSIVNSAALNVIVVIIFCICVARLSSSMNEVNLVCKRRLYNAGKREEFVPSFSNDL